MSNDKKQTPEQMMASALRYTRGLALLSNPAYSFETIENCPTAFMVTKTGKEMKYYITLVANQTCTCEDFQRTKKACKHLYACEELVEQQAQIEQGYDPNEFAELGY